MTLKPANYKHRSTKGTSLTGGKGMRYVYAKIELTNEDHLALHRYGMLPENEIKRITCKALVDPKGEQLIVNPPWPNNPRAYIRSIKQVSLSI
jgi:hypothetical protein